MKSTKKREIGLGDSLYGIPLDDILTPEEINSMRKDTSAASRRKRRERKKKSYNKRLALNKIKLPKIKITKNIINIVSAVALVLILLLIFKNPIIARIAPKKYVADAFCETVSKVEYETEQIIENIFGFDLFDKKELTLSANGSIDADSANIANDLSVNIETGFSRKNSNAVARWQCVYGGEELISSTAYINEDEVGISVPQIFSEYWTAPANSFGKEWNESGLRKVLYFDAVGEDADLSFLNTFGRKTFISEQGKKEAERLTKRLISSSKAKYNGKTEIDVNGESKLARSVVFSFAQEDITEYLTGILHLTQEDEELSKVLSAIGKSEQVGLLFDDVSARLANSVIINDARITLAVYKNVVRSAQLDISYTENGKNPRIIALLSSEDLKYLTDNIKFWVDVKGSDKDFSYTLSSSGNHSGGKKVFTDITSVNLVSNGYNYSLNSEVALDFKEGTVNGSITGADIYSTKALSYSGICTKKGGLKLELADVNTSTTGNYPRKLSGKLNVSIVPDMKISKINTSNKKFILDYSKAEAENYLMRLEQTDSVKKIVATVNSIFNKAE